MPEKRVGKVEHYYPKAKAAAVHLEGKVKVGDKIHIVGHGDDVREEVTSLQLDRVPIQEGKPGQHVGVFVPERVHEGDEVMLVESAIAKAVKSAPSRRAPLRQAGTKKAPRPKRATASTAGPNPRKATSKRAKPAKRPKPRKAASKRAKPAKRAKGRKAASKRAKPAERASARSGARPKRKSAKRR